MMTGISFGAELSGVNWTADLVVSGHGEYRHVTARVAAESQEIGEGAAKEIYEIFGEGRVRFVRQQPECHLVDDFETGKPKYEGFVRFSFMTEPGEEILPDTDFQNSMAVTSFAEIPREAA